MRDRTTTDMCYQVEANSGVLESRCRTLKEARDIARRKKKSGCSGVQIARYDASGQTRYYEVIETL